MLFFLRHLWGRKFDEHAVPDLYEEGTPTLLGQAEMKGSTFLPLFLLWIISGTFGALFDLSELQWTLKNQNGSIQIPASGPPSEVHLDLTKAGIITEPLLGINGTQISLHKVLRIDNQMHVLRFHATLGD